MKRKTQMASRSEGRPSNKKRIWIREELVARLMDAKEEQYTHSPLRKR
jgi:hypothetical protein